MKNRQFLRFIRVRYYSLCKVGTCVSAHQYKIQAVTSPDSNRYAIHKHSQAQNIIFQSTYSHLWVHLSVGSAFLQPDKTPNSCDIFFLYHNNNWRASEASETLSGLFNRESWICILQGMCSFQHKWASERQLYLFVLLHHIIMK